jgi:hypothetical protein
MADVPATQPVAEAETAEVAPATQPAQAEAVEEKHDGVISTVVNVLDAAAPTTEPTTAPAVQSVQKPEEPSSVTVTELPLDPATAADDKPAKSGDMSK